MNEAETRNDLKALRQDRRISPDLTELGSDFAFLARQKRITIDQRDYYIDLLFYHRRLKCLVAIDLKIGEFDAAFKGQMELYLRYLDRLRLNSRHM